MLSASNFEMADIIPTQAPTQAPASTTQIISGLSNTAFGINVGIAALAVVIGVSFTFTTAAAIRVRLKFSRLSRSRQSDCLVRQVVHRSMVSCRAVVEAFAEAVCCYETTKLLASNMHVVRCSQKGLRRSQLRSGENWKKVRF